MLAGGPYVLGNSILAMTVDAKYRVQSRKRIIIIFM